MDYIILTGLVAGVLTTFAILPEIARIIKLRSAEDLSYGWMLMLLCGYALWIYYGSAIASLPLILFNAISVAMVLLLALLKSKYK